MHFAVTQNAVAVGHSADTPELAAKQRRVSTTATLVAVAICALVGRSHLLQARAPAPDAAHNSGTTPVTVVAPEFCKDQTWPYIDARCLRRVDNPPPSADEHKPLAPRPTAAATAASDGTRGSAGPVPRSVEASAPTNTPPAAAAAPDPRRQVIQSVFPPPAPTGDNQRSDAGPVADPTYQRTSDGSPRHRSRHWGRHSGFFGFRF